MVIELKQSDNPEWKPKLVFTKLAVGDYLVLSVERMHKEITGGYSRFMCFVKVYEYSFFDTTARKVVDTKFPDGEEAITFFNEGIYAKISKNPEKTLIKISAVETKGGMVAYIVNPFELNKTLDSPEVTEIDFDNNGKMLTEKDKEDILTAIKSSRALGLDDTAILNLLKNKYPEESVKELINLK